jgi:acyl-CoA thioesterase-2
MDAVLADLISVLDLETIEANIFRGPSRDIGSPQVFGGQVLGQALIAANRTVDQARTVHSLHAYFLRRGDVNAPVVYEVDRARDGGSFTNRRVIAIQHGRQIFNMAASFQVAETGLEHAVVAPDVPGPEGLRDITDFPPGDMERLPAKVQEFLRHRRPFHFRVVEDINVEGIGGMQPVKHVWIKALDKLPDNRRLHQAMLAYVSDYELLGTAVLPHGRERVLRGELQMASLDHAMWFHRSCRADEWLLYAFDSPTACGSRGLARGQMFRQDGQLVLSTVQEGLIRLR